MLAKAANADSIRAVTERIAANVRLERAMPEGWTTQWSIHVAVNFVTLIRVLSSVVRCECAILSLSRGFFQSQAQVSSTSLPSMSQSCTDPKTVKREAKKCEVARKDEAEKTRRLDARLIPHVRK
jgi:hypothetical protein